MKHFLEMPYVEDVFGSDDDSRNKWMSELTNLIKNPLYNDLRRVNIFTIGALGAMSLREYVVSEKYLEKSIDGLKKRVEDCEFLLPFSEDQGVDCKVNREKYDAMGFKKKRAHVYEIKENVFGFLSCLTAESSRR